MNLELQKRLFDKHPLFFRRPKVESDSGPLDYWGIEISNGWFDLLNQLSFKFEESISDAVARGVPIYECPRASQIKDKFGELRVHVDGYEGLDPSVVAAIADAELRASQTCEICGKPGSKRHGTWIHIACDQCESSAPISFLNTADDIDQHMILLLDLLESRSNWNGKREIAGDQ